MNKSIIRDGQHGMTYAGMLILMVFIAIVAIVIIKVVPLYLEHFKVENSLKSLAEEARQSPMTPIELEKHLLNRLATQEGAFCVDGQDTVEDRLVEIDHRHPVRTGFRAGVVDEDVNPSEAVDCFTDYSFHVRRVRDVTGETERPAAEIFDLADHLPQPTPIVDRFVAQIVDRHIGTLARQPERNRPSDPALTGSTGDQRYLALESVHRSFLVQRSGSGAAIDGPVTFIIQQ